MSYLLTQLWLSLSIAAVIGGVLGWILRGGCKQYKKNIKKLESRLSKSDKEYVLIKQKAQKLRSIVRERNLLISRFEKTNEQKKILLTKLYKMKQVVKKAPLIHAQMNAKLHKAQEMLVFAKQSQQAKDASLEQLKKESSATEHLLMRCQEDWDAKHRILRSQRDLSLLNQKAAEEKMSLAVNKLKDAEEKMSLAATKLKTSEENLKVLEGELAASQKSAAEGELTASQKRAEDLSKSESKMIELNASFEARTDELTNSLQQEKQKLKEVSAQFTKFKTDAKHYVGSVTKENKSYINIVDKLEESIENGRLVVKEKDKALEDTRVELESNKKEVVTLKQQLHALTELATLSSRSNLAGDSREIKMNQRHGNTLDSGYRQSVDLANRWKQIKKSKLRRRPR